MYSFPHLNYNKNRFITHFKNIFENYLALEKYENKPINAYYFSYTKEVKNISLLDNKNYINEST